MKKAVLLFMMVCASFSAMYAQDKTVYLDLRSFPNWYSATTIFQAWVWGNDFSTYWSYPFTQVPGETFVYELTVPATTVGFLAVRTKSGNIQPLSTSWSDSWNNKSEDMTLADGNCLKIKGWQSGSDRNSCPISKTTYNPPTVSLGSLPAKIFLKESVSLSASPSFVEDPVLSYEVELPNISGFQPATTPYTLQTTPGFYTFRAKVTGSSMPGTVYSATTQVEVVQAEVKLSKPLKTIIAGAAGTVIINSQDDLEDALGEIETNVEDPAYTFWKKVAGESDDAYEVITYPLTLTEGITYTIKVDVAKSGAATPLYLAYDEDDLEIGTFTGLAKTTISGYPVTSGNSIIQAQFEGAAAVELYTVSGVLLKKTVAVGSFERTGLAPGLYIVKINGEASKVAVK
ncbi:MAG: T9SS type A sorting domain-containing protein [Candidatus Azobacteroides sp.]|nr:T9SS type A sorting domain-containing protein [Candidatus Azobacteroides sp.]